MSKVMQQLVEGARALGIDLSPSHLAAFRIYYDELMLWNQRVNLTSITEFPEVQIQHFLDSLAGLLVLEPSSALGASLIDIGAGAGFPGVPLKIVRPETGLALLESTRKKAAFLRHLATVLSLGGTEVLEGRAEEFARRAEYREAYHAAVARAVAELRVLLELALPFLKVGGLFVAYKGRDVEVELRMAERALAILGGRVVEVRPVRLPGLEQSRHLIAVEKIFPTPDRYPRRPGVPAKRPLG